MLMHHKETKYYCHLCGEELIKKDKCSIMVFYSEYKSKRQHIWRSVCPKCYCKYLKGEYIN